MIRVCGEAKSSETGLGVESFPIPDFELADAAVSVGERAGDGRNEIVVEAPCEQSDGEVEGERAIGGALEVEQRGE